MVIGDRLKKLREQKHLSQGDIEKHTGLLRCYISRVENGHTVPSVATLEKMAGALAISDVQTLPRRGNEGGGRRNSGQIRGPSGVRRRGMPRRSDNFEPTWGR